MSSPSTEAPSLTLDADQRIDLPAVGWKGYCALLKMRGERRFPKLLYLDGSISFVSPSPIHERGGERLGFLVAEVAFALDIPFETTGSTTFRRRAEEAGAEPDKSFYFAQVEQIRGKDQISLLTEPPPDLVIEVVHTHHAETAIEIYRRFGVPELWIWENSTLRILALQPDGLYKEIPTSVFLAPLTAADVAPWISRAQDNDFMITWMRDLRRWVQDVLLPRRNAQPR